MRALKGLTCMLNELLCTSGAVRSAFRSVPYARSSLTQSRANLTSLVWPFVPAWVGVVAGLEGVTTAQLQYGYVAVDGCFCGAAPAEQSDGGCEGRVQGEVIGAADLYATDKGVRFFLYVVVEAAVEVILPVFSDYEIASASRDREIKFLRDVDRLAIGCEQVPVTVGIVLRKVRTAFVFVFGVDGEALDFDSVFVFEGESGGVCEAGGGLEMGPEVGIRDGSMEVGMCSGQGFGAEERC